MARSWPCGSQIAVKKIDSHYWDASPFHLIRHTTYTLAIHPGREYGVLLSLPVVSVPLPQLPSPLSLKMSSHQPLPRSLSTLFLCLLGIYHGTVFPAPDFSFKCFLSASGSSSSDNPFSPATNFNIHSSLSLRYSLFLLFLQDTIYQHFLSDIDSHSWSLTF